MMAMTASNPNEHERHNSIHAYGNAPGRRAGHTSTAVGKRIYIFGGSCGSDYLSDFFYLDTDPEPDIFVKDEGCMSRLEQNLHQHFDEEQFSDVTFLVEGRKVSRRVTEMVAQGGLALAPSYLCNFAPPPIAHSFGRRLAPLVRLTAGLCHSRR